MARLFIITGPAGVGKSAVSKELAKKLSKSAILEGDEIYHQVVGGEKPWLKGNHLDLMWKNIFDLAQNYLDANIDVIINYIVYKDRLNDIINRFGNYEINFVLLWVDKEIVEYRDNNRGLEYRVGRVEVHFAKFLDQKYDERFFLINNKSLSEVAEEILTGKFICNKNAKQCKNK